ncbi:MAG TPA: MFS transporter, partial [Nevskiaceae bacterium]
ATLISRYGERLAMLWASVLSTVGLALCLVPGRLELLAAGVFILGMATSVLLLSRQTYLIEAVPARMRARAMSSLGGTRRIGVFVGPFLGAGAMHFLGLPGAYWIGVVGMLACAALVYTIPDLDTRGHRAAVSGSSPGILRMLRQHWKTYFTLGFGIMLVSGIRASKRIVIPLWAAHLGIDPVATSVIYGLVSMIDMLAFYPSGMAMDRFGRLWVAVPSVLIMGIAMMLEPLTIGLVSFVIVSMAIGLGNGIGSGLVMTIGADASPRDGRTQFLGLWRLFSDIGASATPVLLSAVAAVATLAAGIVLVGAFGPLAAVVFWRWLPHRVRAR